MRIVKRCRAVGSIIRSKTIPSLPASFDDLLRVPMWNITECAGFSSKISRNQIPEQISRSKYALQPPWMRLLVLSIARFWQKIEPQSRSLLHCDPPLGSSR